MWLHTDVSVDSPYAAFLTGFVMDCGFTAFLVYHTGSLSSPFVIDYALVLVGLVPSRPQLKELLLFGGIGHLSYVAALYLRLRTFAFYTRPLFLVQCLIMVGVFLNVIRTTRLINDKNLRLATSKEALEEFAAGLKASNERLERLSFTDGLTGAYNYRYFQSRLKEEFNRARKYRLSLAMLMLDVDGFKRFNDTYGHPAGDQVVQQVASLLRQQVRELDTVARYGGDEFVVILADADADLAIKIADRIRREVEKISFGCGICTLAAGEVTVSVGVAVFPDSADSPEQLVKQADEALYRVKLSRKNRTQLYSNVMEDLRTALPANESAALLNTIQTLIMVINARDRYTYGHSERVVRYASAIARGMGMSDEQVRFMKYAAYLHDIGKIEISREILNKKGPLTNEERALIKQHTLFGASIIEPIKSLELVIPCVLHHHERYDGLGYPNGLAGGAIPLEARILAVADSFDAMMSNRPHRDALEFAEARAELEHCAGSQFDPKVVEVFLASLEGDRARLGTDGEMTKFLQAPKESAN
jgi:diguanylate cyclase (GGDEF)-like protein/putative nucleotidyltransferase with HDIG domain